MESYWCEKKNSIVEMMKNPKNFNPVLTCASSLNATGGIMGNVSKSAKYENNKQRGGFDETS